jgi:hypothetical protein
MPDDHDPNIVEELVGLMGARLDRVSLGVLSAHKDREPVVPPDLHLVKAAKPDGDNNVPCMYCGTLVPYAAAVMIDSAGMACGTCQRPTGPALPIDTKIRRRVWPWFVGGTLAAGLVLYGIWHHEQAMDRAEYEHEYPAANRPGDDAVIARNLERWRVEPVIAGVATPPAIASVHLGTACDVSTERAMEFRAGEVEQLKGSLSTLFQDAKRGRYYDERSRERTLAQIAGPIVVIAIAESETPEMVGSGSNVEYYGGHRTGAAYVYDIDGSLRCAGAFEAASSDVVSYRHWKSNDPHLNGDEKHEATQAVGYDLETKMHAAIVAGLHRVE